MDWRTRSPFMANHRFADHLDSASATSVLFNGGRVTGRAHTQYGIASFPLPANRSINLDKISS
jgi:hypothetical protein